MTYACYHLTSAARPSRFETRWFCAPTSRRVCLYRSGISKNLKNLSTNIARIRPTLCHILCIWFYCCFTNIPYFSISTDKKDDYIPSSCLTILHAEPAFYRKRQYKKGEARLGAIAGQNAGKKPRLDQWLFCLLF